jgi:hypothetical protein
VNLPDRHTEALQRFMDADKAWTDEGNEPYTFHLVATGAMESVVNHPGWGDDWPAPAASTIDDLGEAGFLRVEPPEPSSNGRVFDLTLAGRNALSGGEHLPKNPVGFS